MNCMPETTIAPRLLSTCTVPAVPPKMAGPPLKVPLV
ncbi:hypothetical protein FHU14_005012, partial [Mesorhizobium sp. RMAD-H1]|nr:hypothetical protein [Mesorhizobium sp. RMAD-H1]